VLMQSSARPLRIALIGTWIVLALGMSYGPLATKRIREKAPIVAAVCKALFEVRQKAPDYGDEYDLFVTESGLELSVPKRGPEKSWSIVTYPSGLKIYMPRGDKYDCSTGPLLRTPFPSPTLMLRVPGRIDLGFKNVPPN